MQTPYIMIVEDDKVDQLFLQRAISKLDMDLEIDFSDTAEIALNKLDNGAKPKLILTDLSMPGMGGMEFLTRIKQDEEHKLIPALVFSTSNNLKDIEEAYSRHANSYLVKPTEITEYDNLASRLFEFWFEQAVTPITDTQFNFRTPS